MSFKREGMVALTPDRELLAHWCSGCQCVHIVNLAGDRPRWDWNGDVDKPTLSPSIRVFWPANGDKPETTRCHYFLNAGVINYLDDSAEHTLRGLNPLQLIPDDYGGVDP